MSPASRDTADDRTQRGFDQVAQFAAATNPVLGILMLHPELAEIYMPFSDYLKNRGSLPTRERELVILRTAWNCGADYQWVAHRRSARESGITDEEIEWIALGAEALGWDADDSALLRAVDELCENQRVGDHTWDCLRKRLDPKSVVELLMLVGNYQMIALVMNSVGIKPTEPAPNLPGNSFSFIAESGRPPVEE